MPMTPSEAEAYHNGVKEEAKRFYQHIESETAPKQIRRIHDRAIQYQMDMGFRYIRRIMMLNVTKAKLGDSCPFRSTILPPVPRSECPACQAERR